jgi:hypothetical protein
LLTVAEPEKEATGATHSQDSREKPTRLRHRFETDRVQAEHNQQSDWMCREKARSVPTKWRDLAWMKFGITPRCLPWVSEDVHRHTISQPIRLRKLGGKFIRSMRAGSANGKLNSGNAYAREANSVQSEKVTPWNPSAQSCYEPHGGW